MSKSSSTRVRVKALAVALVGLFVISIGVLGQIHPAQAATSSNLNFQARLLNNLGGVVPDGNYNIDFKIYNADSTTGTVGTCSGACVWEETRTNAGGQGVQVINGYFSVNLGSVTAFASTINWDQQLWLTMNIGGTSTGAVTWDGEMQNAGHSIALTALPYAFMAGQLASGTGASRGVLKFASLGQATTVTLPDPGAGTATVCYQSDTNCGFVTGTNNSFIQNQTASLQQANFRIQSAASGSIAAQISGASGQSVDIFDVFANAVATPLFGVGKTGLVTLQPSAALVNGDTGLAQTLTNGSSTGGTVYGFLQDIAVSNTSSAATTIGTNITLTDNTSLANNNTGLKITLQGSNASQSQIGADISVNKGTGLKVTNTSTSDSVLIVSNAALSGNALRVQGNGPNDVFVVGNNGQSNFFSLHPATVAGTGTNAPDVMDVTGATGGNTTGSATVGGAGSGVNFTLGNGGSGGGGTNALGGPGGSFLFAAGNGGGASGTASNSNGGSITFQAGAAGTGGSGAAGVAGSFIVKNFGDSFRAFQVQTSAGADYLSVNTLDGFVINNGITELGNLVQNPSFEATGTTDATGWYTPSVSQVITTDSSNARSGNHELQVSGNSSTHAVTTKYFAVHPGDTIYAEAYVKNSAGANGDGGIYLEFSDKDKANATFSNADTGLPGTSYVAKTITAAVPSGKVFVRIAASVKATATAGTFYFDDFYLKRVNEQAPLLITNTSSTAFQVQNSSGVTVLGVDATTGKIFSNVATSGSAVGFTLNTTNSLSTAGAKLLSVQNNGAEEFSVDKDGNVNIASGAVYKVNNTQIATTNLSDGAQVALKNAANTFSSTNSFQVTNTNGFQVQDAAGAHTYIQADTNGGTLYLGNTQTGSTIQIGNSTGAAVTQTISIGSSNATASSASTITIGSTIGGALTLQPGGGIIIAAGALGTADNTSYLCRNSANKLATCITTGTGVAFINGGNTLGSLTGNLASIGTNDANSLQIKTNNVGRATFDQSNNLFLGNADGGGTNAAPNNFNVKGSGSSTAGTAGGDVGLYGGAGASSTTGSAGGNITINGGAAGGTGNNAGGNITLVAGLNTGSAAAGGVTVKNAANSTSAFQVQTTGSAAVFSVNTSTPTITVAGGTVFTSNTYTSGANSTITQSLVDNNTTISATATAASLTFTVPAPTTATTGRLLYIGNGGTNAFTLNTGGGSYNLAPGSSATLIYIGSAWTIAGIDASTLQLAYTNSTGGVTPEIKLDSTRATLNIQDADSTISADILDVNASNGGGGGLGTVVFGVGNGGATKIHTTGSGSTTAFVVQNANSNNFITVDTTSGGNSVSLDSDTGTAGTINIGNIGGHAQTVNIGLTASNASNSTINIATNANASATNLISIGSNGNTANGVTIEAGNTGGINLGNTDVAHTFNIGNGGSATAQTLNLGSNSSTGAVNIKAGGSGITLNTNGASAGTTVKSVTSNSAVAFQVQNASANSLFNVDSSGNIVTLGSTAQALNGTQGIKIYGANSTNSAVDLLTPVDAAANSLFYGANNSRAQFGFDGTNGNAAVKAASSFGFEVQTGGSGSNVMAIGTTGLVTLQPSAGLTAGQSALTQTLTNASSTGGTVNGYSQTISVAPTSSASTTNGFNISLTDNTALGNTNKGLNISLAGSNTSQTQYGIDVSTNGGVGVRGTATGTTGVVTCGAISGLQSIGVCGANTGSSGNGVVGSAISDGTALDSNLVHSGSAVSGFESAAGTAGKFYSGLSGFATQTNSAAYTSIGVFGSAKAQGTATTYGGYFNLASTSGATQGAALYASNTSIAANILNLQDNTTDVLTVRDGGLVGIQNTFTAMTVPGTVTPTIQNGGSLSASQAYFYKVTAIDSAGGETTASAEATCTTGVTTCPATGSTAANKTIALSWTAITGASGYKIYRSTTTGTEVYYTTVRTSSFTDSGQFTAGSGSAPGSNTAAVSTNNSNSLLQISVGGNGTPTGQVYVSGVVPSSKLAGLAGGLVNSHSVFTLGRYAYVAATTGGLAIFDVSNPASPALMSSTSTGLSTSWSVYVQGRYAYVASRGNDSIVIFDVSNPNSPTSVGTLTAGIKQPSHVFVGGRYAYITNGAAAPNARLLVADVSNPAAPTVVSSITTGLNDPESVFVQSGYAYVASQANATLAVFNVSNPGSITSAGTITTGLSNPTDVVAQGRYVYVADQGTGLSIYDVANPSSPAFVGTATGSGDAYSVSVQGRYAYVADNGFSRLYVVDISNPYAATSAGFTNSGLSDFRSVFVSGRYAYAADANNGLVTFDLGGTYSQQLEAGGAEFGTLGVNGSANINGTASITGGLTLGASLQAAGSISTSSNLYVQGGAAFAGGLFGGTTVNNLSTPGAPTITSVGANAGTVTWTYQIVAVSASGGVTPAGASGSVSASDNATLTTSNYNLITWSPVSGAVGYKVYRTAVGTSPNTTGCLSSCATIAGNTLADTGLAADGSTAPTTDSTGNTTIDGLLTLQPATSLIAGQSALTQTFTNGSTTGGLVNGYSQTITVNNTTSASTTTALNLTLSDNAGGTLVNINKGLVITMNGSNAFQKQLGIDVSTTKGGIGIRSVVVGSTASFACADTSVAVVALCGDGSVTGVYGRSQNSINSITSPQATGVYGTNTASVIGGSYVAGVKGITTGTGVGGTAIGVLGQGDQAAGATIYGGYFQLGTGGATLGSALYATNSTVAANILQLQDGSGTPSNVLTIADEGAVTFQNHSNSAAAFQVQNLNSRSLFNIDSSTTNITVGNTTDGSQLTLGATGNVNSVIRKTMVVNGTIAANDLVQIDTANAGQVKQAVASSTNVFGIASSAVGSGSSQDIVISGVYQVNANASGGTINVGDVVVSSSTAGQVTKTGTTTASGTVVGLALSTLSGGKIWVYINLGLGGSDNLQTVYNKSTGGSNATPTIKLSSGVGGINIQDADTTLGTDLLDIRASNGGGLGTVLFGVASTGSVTVQNSGGVQLLNLDSTADASNLITNGSFEVNTSGWTAKAGTGATPTLTQVTSGTVSPYVGTGSMSVATTTGDATNSGVKWSGTFTNSQAYNFTVYARASGSNFATFQLGNSNNNSTDTSCLTAQTVVTGGWTRFTCSFTYTGTTGTSYVYVKQTDATNRTYYLDALKLETTSISTPYKESTISLNGVFNQPGTFKNQSDSTTAFQVQNSGGGNILVVDSLNKQLKIYDGAGGANYALVYYDSGTSTANYTANTGTVAVGTGAGAITVTAGSGSAVNITANAASNWKTNTGTLTLQSGTGGSDFLILNSGGANQIQISGTSILKLGSTTADPTCVNGAIYYNSTTPQFRGCVNGTWQNLASITPTLQTTYNSSTGSTTPEIKLNVGGTDTAGFDIQDNDTTPVGVLFAVRLGNAGGLGTSLFNVSSTNNTVNIGTSATATALLVLGIDTDSTFNQGTASNVATEVNGAMFYSSTDHNFLCGQAGSWLSCNGLLYSNTSAGSSISTCTTACTNLAAAPIPANYCQAGRSIHIMAKGIYNTSATTFALGTYYGTSTTRNNAANTLIGADITSASLTATTWQWSYDFTIICDSTTVMNGGGVLTLQTNGTTSTTNTVLTSATTTGGTTGLTTTSLKNLYLFPQFGASAAGDNATMHQFIVTGN